jgi:hypothetical protein
MAQATSGEKQLTIDGQKYRLRTQVVYQDGLGVPGTLSTTAPIRYVVQYKPEPFSTSAWVNLGERDTTNQNNWIFTQAAGAGFQKALIENGPNSLTTSLDDATSNALSKSAGVTKQQATQILQVAPNVAPTGPAPVQPTPGGTGGGSQNGPDPDSTTITQDVITNLTQINPDDPNPPFEDLVYPTNIRNNGQDFIKFAVVKYVPRKLDISGGIGVLQERGKLTDILGNIILPIQPSISDSNNVDWNGLGVNPLEMQLVDTSLNLMSASTQDDVQSLIDNAVSKGQKTFSDQNVQRAIKLYFAQKAAGVTGLLSRVSGAIVNPNLELLFQGPTLRPFNFTFRLSPRDNDEATKVRKIIRVFKQYSAVGTAPGGLFLTTPNVFNIQYVSKRGEGEEDHKSLNRIKTCALKSVSVDYTPDGSYMTFNDEARTMTSYSLSLQFQELEPVTTKDYNMDPDHIGY